MISMLTFQQLIARLNEFWEKKGCAIHQGHDLEVGAGTFNPVTFLRCLGPEPYSTAYVEPSRRPQDARYGENPNRVQLFHQYQVILKPSPSDVQRWYLESLEAIGLDLKKHDIRFVHRDSQSLCTKRMSCFFRSRPIASNDSRYQRCTSDGEGFKITWYW